MLILVILEWRIIEMQLGVMALGEKRENQGVQGMCVQANMRAGEHACRQLQSQKQVLNLQSW